MPNRKTLQRAERDKDEGESPSTQAGEFVREEIHHVRRGKHGARSPQQAIAIGLSKAWRAGVEVKPPAPGKANSRTRKNAERDYRRGQAGGRKARKKSSPARAAALKREPRSTVSHKAMSQQARRAARRRKTQGQRTASTRRAA